jgi:hypothetical protein
MVAEYDSRKCSEEFPVLDMWDISQNNPMEWDYSKYCIFS